MLFLPLLLVASACSAQSDQDQAGSTADQSVPSTAPAGDGDGAATSDNLDRARGSEPLYGEAEAAAGPSSALAELITELPAAPTGLPAPPPDKPRPVAMSIESLGVDEATVIDVGVEDNGDMEIPPADQVGWYQYGPSPGQEGSAVLAAHIAFDGRDGVFVRLDELEIGSTITVSYDDGSVVEFVSVSKEQYDKDDLPKESIFDRTGPARLVLITCGGEFNRSLRSYEDNVVVYADAVDATTPLA